MSSFYQQTALAIISNDPLRHVCDVTCHWRRSFKASIDDSFVRFHVWQWKTHSLFFDQNLNNILSVLLVVVHANISASIHSRRISRAPTQVASMCFASRYAAEPSYFLLVAGKTLRNIRYSFRWLTAPRMSCTASYAWS